MAILASVAALLLISVSLEVQPTTAVCDDSTFNTIQCTSCSTLFICFPGPTEITSECSSGQVCGNNGANDMIDGCFDVSDSSNTDQSKCSCDPSSTSPSYMADGQSEDPKAYLACLPGDAAPQSLLCTGDDVFLEGQITPCGAAPPTSPPTTTVTTPTPTTPKPFACSKSGFSADTADCSKYWLCAADDDAAPTEANCDGGMVFNEALLGCFDPCDDSAETFSCAPDITGIVADSVNCSIFHICVGGDPNGQALPCPETQVFDPALSTCAAGDACPVNPCLTCSTTTTALTTEAATTTDATTDDATTDDATTDDATTDDVTTDDATTDDASTDDATTDDATTDDATTDDVTTDDVTTDDATTGDTTPTTLATSDSTSSSASTTVGVPDCSAASEEGYFVNPDSCKTFYSCESDGAGGYVLKEYTCPGSLVFDPTNQYCNLANLVPEC